jgi:hypothetical protein
MDADAGAPLFDPAEDFRSLGSDRRRRRTGFDAAGLRFHRSFPVNPLAGGSGIAEDTSGGLVAAIGARDLVSRPDASRAPADFPGSVGAVVVVSQGGVTEGEPMRGRLVMVVDSQRGVASVLDDRIEQIRDAPWDRITDALRAAARLRAERESIPSTKPAGGRDSVDRSAPAPETTAGDPFPPIWDPDEDLGRSSTVDWDDDLPGSGSAPTTAPTRTSAPPRRRPKPDENRRSDRGTAPPQVDEPSSMPPSTINFWD